MIALAFVVAAAWALRAAWRSHRRQRGGTIDLAHPVGWRALSDNRRAARHSRS